VRSKVKLASYKAEEDIRRLLGRRILEILKLVVTLKIEKAMITMSCVYIATRKVTGSSPTTGTFSLHFF